MRLNELKTEIDQFSNVYATSKNLCTGYDPHHTTEVFGWQKSPAMQVSAHTLVSILPFVETGI